MSNEMNLVRAMFGRLDKRLKDQKEALDKTIAITERAGRATAPQKFLFADRPRVATGEMLNESGQFAYVINGRDVGEGAGLGTGCLAVYKRTPDEWYRVADNTVVVI